MYLTSVGHRAQEPVDRSSGLPDFQWLHTVRGEGVVELGHEARPLPAGHGFLTYPGVRHHYWPVGDWETMWFTFNGCNVDAFLSAWRLDPGFIDLADDRPLAELIRNIMTRSSDPLPSFSVALSSLLYQALVELVHQRSLEPRTRRNSERLNPAFAFIDANFHRPITLDDVAASVDVTPQHLCRLFRSVVGTSPVQYITSVRMQKAKEYLIDHPDMSIAEVASRTGFENHSYFCSVFKKHERLTPSDFRGKIFTTST